MFIELLLKKNGKILFFVFLLFFIITTTIGVVFVANNLNTNVLEFEKDGYALYLDKVTNVKAEAYSFNSGTEYRYKQSSNTISFKSDDKNVKIDKDTVIHYTDDSLGVLKKVVGIDVSTINNDIIFYYNIYKNTKINSNKDGYVIKLVNEEEVKFKNLLMRISDNKFLLTGENVRLVYTNDEIIDFGNYVEFEYTDGNVVKVYSEDKYYQTISSDAMLLVEDIRINLKDAVIYKEDKPYISLTNLVVDNNGNIDTLEEEIKKEELEIKDGEFDVPSGSTGSSSGNSGSSGSGNIIEDEEDDDSTEEVIDEDEVKKTPVYKVTELILTALKIDAKIEIKDEDALLNSDTTIQIVENATSKVVYDEIAPMGDTAVMISFADLKPDTEYTILASADYKLNDVDYNKIFVSKIFRTEDLGVSFEKNYATQDSLVIEVNKEKYSKVSMFVLEILDLEGNRIDYKTISFEYSNRQDVTFFGLTSDTSYRVRMTEILCQGVIVDQGFAQTEVMKTLKVKPEIGDLSYEIDKKKSQFNLNVSSVTDTNYGITGYRYEIYDARGDITNATPVLTLSEEKLATVSVNVDEIKLYRGIPYTYVLVVEFYDNEKVVEYSKELGSTMTLDGVEFPTLRFDEKNSYVTWEQINGAIIVEDPSNAIVSDKFQVIYKNSIDVYTSTTIIADTETGYIPININGLRANETYTFQVYGTINMQDGNETEDSVYIGSVFVQTKKPQSLVAVFSTTSDYTSAFSINFKLEDDTGDASLEASTLSEMTFTIYKGSTIDGARQIYKRTLDSNGDPYVSTLKEDFYDNNAIIDPQFFDSRNSDYYEETYTLEVSRAYDYTSYKNEIPIKNNIFSFKLNSYIPELPENVNDSVIVNTITNNTAKSFGLKKDENLEGNITVGYGLLPKYNNETKTASYIHWHVYMFNPQTGEYDHLENLDRKVDYPEDGVLKPTIFELSNGTENSVYDDDKLRRGNEYYFTYEIYLDVNGDGEVDVEYPKKIDENVILRSKILYPLKQTSTVKLYPSISTANTYTWNYKIVDIDKALENSKLYSFVEGSQAATSSPDVLVGQDEFNTVTFTGLKANKNVVIKVQERTLKSREPVYDTLTQQYFGTVRNSLELEYDVMVDVNKLVISIKDYYDNLDLINSIAVVDVVITPSNQEDLNKIGIQTIKGIKLDNENIVIDFFKIYKYLAVDIDVDVIAYYDSGIMGFDLTSEYVAVQKVSTTMDTNYYIYNDSKDSISQNSIVSNSIYQDELKLDEGILSLTTINGKKVDFEISLGESGIIYDENNIVLKELKTQKLSSINKNVRFDLIIPGISMLDSSNKINIRSLLDSAEVNAKIINLDTVKILNNLIYIELYETDKNGTNAKYITTISEAITAFLGPVEIKDLTPETNYYIQFYTYVYNNELEDYEKRYLYDVDQLVSGCKYNFYTLSSVDVSNIRAQMVERSYLNKYLQIKYNLDVIYGYDHIEYVLQKKVNDTYVDTEITIPDVSTFFTEMTLEIDASPGKNPEIVYGGEYKIIIKPVGYYENENGEKLELDLGTVSHTFTIDESQQPYIGISSGKSSNMIYFRVSVSDPDYIIVNGTYDLVLVDEDGLIIAELKKQSISKINKRYEFKGSDYELIEGKTYTLIVTAKTDTKNSNTNFETRRLQKSIIYGDYVDLGTVTTTRNVDDPLSIDVIFSDSYKLTMVDTVQYTITSNSTDFYLSNTTEFIVRYDADKGLYYFTIPISNSASYLENHMYNIGMNFYSKNKLVTQTETSYYYVP